VPDRQTSEQVFDGCAIGEIGGLLGVADNFFETPKEEHFDVNGGRRSSHREIVARPASRGQRLRVG